MRLLQILKYSLICWIIVSILLHLKVGDNWITWVHTGNMTPGELTSGNSSSSISLSVRKSNSTSHVSSQDTSNQNVASTTANIVTPVGSTAEQSRIIVGDHVTPNMLISRVDAKSPESERLAATEEKSQLVSELPAASSDKFKTDALPAKSYPVLNQTMATVNMSWIDFVKIPHKAFLPGATKSLRIDPITLSHMTFCGADVEASLTAPLLAEESFKWCQWALNDTHGGGVKVGKSFGKLSPGDRSKYEQLQCNTVAQGTNPSCDDIWGEKMVTYWKNNVVPELCSKSPSGRYSSHVKCIESVVRHRLCTFENVMFNFSKVRDSYQRPKRGAGGRVRHTAESRTREFDPGFMATHCEPIDIEHFPFYNASVVPNQVECSLVINEPVIVFSHDDLRNLGHAMSDIMNVWTMLWLTGLTAHSHEVTFLNIDSFRGGHNFDDNLFDFGLHYEKTFARVLKASDLATMGQTVCFKKLVIQPKPLILYTWDGWWQDMPCTFVGPSSLYQRWNMQIRDNYGLLSEEHMVTNNQMRILLITRRLNGPSSSNLKYYSRVISNEEAVVAMLRRIPGVEIISRDLAAMSFEEQVRLISTVGIVIGMHGAGIPNSMHMPVGSRYCCGVIEIFPEGEFVAIRGYGNMARKMGHAYSSLMLDGSLTTSRGTLVNTTDLNVTVQAMIKNIVDKPTHSCILPKVVSDPYFDAYPAKVWEGFSNEGNSVK